MGEERAVLAWGWLPGLLTALGVLDLRRACPVGWPQGEQMSEAAHGMFGLGWLRNRPEVAKGTFKKAIARRIPPESLA